MAIHYAPLSICNKSPALRMCGLLNAHAARLWEQKKMDRVMWEAIKEACIAGDSYLYFYDGALDCQIIDNMSVFLGDEQQPDLQRQPYIILYERRNVEEIRKRPGRTVSPRRRSPPSSPTEDAEGRPGTTRRWRAPTNARAFCT
jgi:hypothetical protein